ncbi:Kelch motif protein [Planctomycetes bacterium MalM25]|nr:Kelch motif protein [Planctomycetes bacterium MalM25]
MIRQLLVLTLLACVAPACAHFPWLYVNDDAYPRLFFGEGLSDRDYHLPESVEGAEIHQSAIDAPAKLLTMEGLEEEGFFGLEGEDPIEPRGRLTTTIVYGSYHGSKLTYYAQHFPAEAPQAWPAAGDDAKFQATLGVAGDELVATILWDGEPAAATGVTLSNEVGGEGVSTKTDAEGIARFPLDKVHDGLNGLMVMKVDKNDRGEVNGKDYTSATHILTATFHFSEEAASKTAAALPALPEAVTSFGAASTDGWLYVYSGHIGQAHDHSRDNLSKHFRRIRLDGEGDWEELPAGPPLQGMAMVPHGGKVYRIGGLDARNPSGEEEDMHSVDRFSCYDPAAGEWAELTPLPKPRSSHNAVVIDDTLYVAGGWRLSGDSEGDWEVGALAYDLTDEQGEWVMLPEPPFKCRALAVGQVDGLVAVLCGLTDETGMSKAVHFYDPATRAWSAGPEFPGKSFHGFGLAAWNVDGVLYAGGMGGTLYKLNEDRSEWVEADKFETKRFFHQLVPDGQGGLLAVAGASPSTGHTGNIERLDLVMPEPAAEEEPAEATVAAE